VIAVKMSLAAVERLAQRIEDDCQRWLIKSVRGAIGDHLWTPAAINALPTVALECQDAKATVDGIVTAFGWRSTSLIPPILMGSLAGVAEGTLGSRVLAARC
jgi:hypothetical protein